MPITIRTKPALEKQIAEIFPNKTSGAETILEAWAQMRKYTLAELKGKFTRGELMCIIDLFNGTIFEPKFASHSQYLKFQIEDGERFQNQAEHFEFSYPQLLKKVETLTSAQTYFLLESINWFWYKNMGADLDEFIESLI